MKSFISTAHAFIIALWPITFLYIIIPIERSLTNMVHRTFEPRYFLWLSLIYIVCGCLFAVCGFRAKGYCGRKDILYANIVAGASVFLIFAVWLLRFAFLNMVFFDAIVVFVALRFASSSVFALVVGYTFCMSVRAIVLYISEIRSAK